MVLPDLPKGLGAREYGKFRQSLHGQVGVGVLSLDEAHNETLEVTASGDTEILPAPGSDKYLTIKGFHFSNASGATVTVCLKAGTGGLERFNTMLVASGGNFDKNLIGRNWRLPINKSLIVNLSGASDVLVTVEYEGLGEPGEEATYLTDSVSFAEALSKGEDKKVTDSQTITEAKVKSPVMNKTEAMPVTEALANVSTLNVSDILAIAESETEETGIAGLADTITIAEALEATVGLVEAEAVAIAEAVGNLITLSLNDSVGVVDSNVVIVHTPG